MCQGSREATLKSAVALIPSTLKAGKPCRWLWDLGTLGHLLGSPCPPTSGQKRRLSSREGPGQAGGPRTGWARARGAAGCGACARARGTRRARPRPGPRGRAPRPSGGGRARGRPVRSGGGGGGPAGRPHLSAPPPPPLLRAAARAMGGAGRRRGGAARALLPLLLSLPLLLLLRAAGPGPPEEGECPAAGRTWRGAGAAAGFRVSCSPGALPQAGPRRRPRTGLRPGAWGHGRPRPRPRWPCPRRASGLRGERAGRPRAEAGNRGLGRGPREVQAAAPPASRPRGGPRASRPPRGVFSLRNSRCLTGRDPVLHPNWNRNTFKTLLF